MTAAEVALALQTRDSAPEMAEASRTSYWPAASADVAAAMMARTGYASPGRARQWALGGEHVYEVRLTARRCEEPRKP